MSQSGMINTSGGGGAGSPIQTITGNTGGPVPPTANNINVVTANSTPVFAGNVGTSTETLDFGLSNLLLGASGSFITSASGNSGYGFGALVSLTSGINNSAFGFGSLSSVTTTNDNSAFGEGALRSCIGTSNTAIGFLSGSGLLSGSSNLMLGANSGANYTGSEGNNICIGAGGTTGESHTTHLGFPGLQTSCFIAGVTGVTVAASAPVGIATTGQMSSLGYGTSAQVLTSNGAGVSPTWQTVPAAFAYTHQTGATYQILVTDDIIGVSRAGVVNVTTPAAGAGTGQSWTVKDESGAAAANNITITAGTGTIDGAATFVINTNFGSATFYFTGTNYFVI